MALVVVPSGARYYGHVQDGFPPDSASDGTEYIMIGDGGIPDKEFYKINGTWQRKHLSVDKLAEEMTLLRSTVETLDSRFAEATPFESTDLLRSLKYQGDIASQRHIGQVGGYGVVRKVLIMRPANATAYTANDVIVDVITSGNAQMVIPNAVRVPGGACYLHGITVKGDQAGGGGAETWQPKVFIHQAQRLTVLADNAPLTLSFAIQKQTGFLRDVTLPPLAAPAGGTIDEAAIENISILLQAAANSVDLPFDLQTLTAFTPSSGALYEVAFYLTQL